MTSIELLKSVECSEPLKSGMYLHLLHGRKTVDEGMDDWGEDGPYFGPLHFVHITYNSAINVGVSHKDSGQTGPMTSKADGMCFTNDLLYYDGMYYGDWELAMEGLEHHERD